MSFQTNPIELEMSARSRKRTTYINSSPCRIHGTRSTAVEPEKKGRKEEGSISAYVTVTLRNDYGPSKAPSRVRELPKRR